MTLDPNGSFDPCSFSQVAEAYLLMHSEGTAPTFDEMVEAFPHLKSEILEKLPTMQVLETGLGKGFHPSVKPNQPIAGCFLGEEIGRGASGIVYRATQPDLNREVAVKVIRLLPRMSKRFEVERQVMGLLDHPNIVPVYAFEEHESQAYLIMKLIEGFSFQQMLESDCSESASLQLRALRGDWTKFAEIAIDIASALEHAHGHDLVHRDIKPANLILDKHGHVWIADFGLVKKFSLTQSLSATGDLIGTPRYMSPEQLRGACDARSDIYSLGLSLYELAFGEKALNSDATELKQVTSPAKHNVPSMLVDIIEKASAFAPEDRFQSAAEFKHVLHRFIDNEIPDRRQGRRKPDKEFHHTYRRNTILAMAAAALTGILGFVAIDRVNLGSRVDSSAQQQTDLATDPQTTDPPMPVGPTHISRTEAVGLPSRRPPTHEPSNPKVAEHTPGLLPAESKAIVSGLGELIEGIESGAVSDEAVTEVVRRYRESSLLVASRVMRVCPLIKTSGLSTKQKQQGFKVVSKLARLAGYGQMRESRAVALLDLLTGGKTMSAQSIAELKVSDQRLAKWLKIVESQTKGYSVSELDLTDAVGRVFSPTQQRKTNQKSRKSSMDWDKMEELVDGLPDHVRERALREMPGRRTGK